MLYRATDCLCRRGAPVVNLAYSGSLDSCDENAPSNPGIKHVTVSRDTPFALGLAYENAASSSREPHRPRCIASLGPTDQPFVDLDVLLADARPAELLRN